MHSLGNMVLIDNLVVRRKKVILPSLAEGHRRTAEIRANLSQTYIVAVEHELAARLEIFGEHPLLFHKRLGRREIFHVSGYLGNTRKYRDIRPEPTCNAFDVTRPVGGAGAPPPPSRAPPRPKRVCVCFAPPGRPPPPPTNAWAVIVVLGR